MDLRDGDHGTVEARLRKLERANRGLILALVVAVGLAMLAGATLAPGDVLEAKRLLILDDGGQIRGEFGVTNEGHTGLWMYEGTKDARVRLIYTPRTGPFLQLTGSKESVNARLSVTPSDDSVMSLSNESTIIAATPKGGGAAMMFKDKAGAVRSAIGFNPDGSPVRAATEKVKDPLPKAKATLR